MNYNFRIATQQDLPEVLRLFSDAIKQLNSQGIDQWDAAYPDYDTLFSDIQKQQMYLVIQDDMIVSAVILNEEQDPQYQTAKWKHPGGKIAVIHRLCVKPSEQGKSLGKKTILLAEQELLRQEYDSVRLDAFPQNPTALRLYGSLGYQKTGEVFFRKGKFYLYEKLLHTQAEL
jgi:ribosomal protein S18 acetylase RimI-like enzyme